MRESFAHVTPGLGSLPQGRVPTTREWNEFEARLDRQPTRFVSAGEQRQGRRPKPLPVCTDEQAMACGPALLKALDYLQQVVAERGQLTDLVVAGAWLTARKAIERTANHVARLVEADEEKAQAAGANPADGSGREAGDAQIHRSEGSQTSHG